MTQYGAVPKESLDDGSSGMEKRILLLTCPCHFLTHFSTLVFPAMTIPIGASLGMPLEEVLKLSFLMYLVYGIGALPVGYLADRWQARKLLIAGVFAMGAGLILAGCFPSPRSMPLYLLIVGLGASIYHPAGLALISRTVKKRGHALGVNGVYGNLGIATAPLITGILTWLAGWQAALVILGAAILVTAFVVSLIRIDETPRPIPAEKTSDRGYIVYFMILCIALVFGGLIYRGNTILLPAYIELNTSFFATWIGALSFIETHGRATLAATVLTSAIYVFGILGQLLGGKLSDKYDLRYAYLAVHAATVPCLVGMALASDYLLVVCAAVYVLFSLGMQPIENSLVAALTPQRWRSTGYAVKFVLVFGVGAMSVHLVGAVKTAYSLRAVYGFFGGIAFLLVLSIIGLIVASRRVREFRNE